jgi:hypothetical protein
MPKFYAAGMGGKSRNYRLRRKSVSRRGADVEVHLLNDMIYENLYEAAAALRDETETGGHGIGVVGGENKADGNEIESDNDVV